MLPGNPSYSKAEILEGDCCAAGELGRSPLLGPHLPDLCPGPWCLHWGGKERPKGGTMSQETGAEKEPEEDQGSALFLPMGSLMRGFGAEGLPASKA